MDSAFPRLHVVTDTRAVAVNHPLTVVRAAIAAAQALGAAQAFGAVRVLGATQAFGAAQAFRASQAGGGAQSLGVTAGLAVQVRVEDDVTDREAYELTTQVLGMCRTAGVLCLVNDRLHIALAAGADGAHVGADDLPVAAARRVLDHSAVLGATCRHPGDARRAVADGATYLGVGPAFATGTKSGLPDPIGPAGIGAVAGAVPATPVIAIGGVTVASVAVLRAAGAYGVAVVGALSSAADPQRTTSELLAAVTA